MMRRAAACGGTPGGFQRYCGVSRGLKLHAARRPAVSDGLRSWRHLGGEVWQPRQAPWQGLGSRVRWMSAANKSDETEERKTTGLDEPAGKGGQPVSVWDDAFNVPNALTMTRIVATPGICYLIANGNYKPAIAAFWVAGFLDWVDGYLARKWDQKTVLGSFLDPLADKVFVAGTMFTLTFYGLVPLPLGVLIIGRDAVLVLGSFYARYATKAEGSDFFDLSTASGVTAVEASEISRWNTLFQFGLVWFTMTHLAFDLPTAEMMPVIWGISGTSTVLSGADYYWRGNWRNIFSKQK